MSPRCTRLSGAPAERRTAATARTSTLSGWAVRTSGPVVATRSDPLRPTATSLLPARVIYLPGRGQGVATPVGLCRCSVSTRHGGWRPSGVQTPSSTAQVGRPRDGMEETMESREIPAEVAQAVLAANRTVVDPAGPNAVRRLEVDEQGQLWSLNLAMDQCRGDGGTNPWEFQSPAAGFTEL